MSDEETVGVDPVDDDQEFADDEPETPDEEDDVAVEDEQPDDEDGSRDEEDRPDRADKERHQGRGLDPDKKTGRERAAEVHERNRERRAAEEE